MNIETVREICKESGLPFEFNGIEIAVKSDLFNHDWDYFFCLEKIHQLSVFCRIKPGFQNEYETVHDNIQPYRYHVEGDEIVGLTEESLTKYLQLFHKDFIATLEKRALKELDKDFE